MGFVVDGRGSSSTVVIAVDLHSCPMHTWSFFAAKISAALQDNESHLRSKQSLRILALHPAYIGRNGIGFGHASICALTQ
jgi:hypothetical protein